jgi:hypothetical protein
MRPVRGLPAAAAAAAAAATAAVALVAGCAAAVQPVGAGQGATPAVQATAVSAMKACQVPENLAGPAPGQGLNGPAVADLTGGAVSGGGFSLDGGRFSIQPPSAGAAPRVSRTLAECEALAAIASDGEPFISTDGVSEMAVGYGLVTVSAGLPVSSWQGHYPGITLPTPAPSAYQGRLAWVAVFRVTDRDNCPGVTQTDAPSPDGAYNGYYYEVFIVDAATGGDAVTYEEAVPDQCDGPGVSTPSVTIPVELTSVRWKLDSRGPHSDTLTAYVPPCLDYDKQVGFDLYSNQVRVLAYGQVAASCGPPRPVSVRLELDSDSNPGWPRPLNPVHAATGLYLTGTGEPLPP